MEETKINEILQKWRKYYKGRCGIAGEFSDAEVLEQLAIEQFKGTLNEWINASCGFIPLNLIRSTNVDGTTNVHTKH